MKLHIQTAITAPQLPIILLYQLRITFYHSPSQSIASDESRQRRQDVVEGYLASERQSRLRCGRERAIKTMSTEHLLQDVGNILDALMSPEDGPRELCASL